jgi:hypothetical protein
MYSAVAVFMVAGLSSPDDIQLVCSSSSIGLSVPGQYALLLPLDVMINDAAESVKFMKKKQTLTAKFAVVSNSSTAASSAANGSSAGQQQQQQQAGDPAQRAAAAAAAAEEAARREQQARLNTEAAEEWMRCARAWPLLHEWLDPRLGCLANCSSRCAGGSPCCDELIPLNAAAVAQ